MKASGMDYLCSDCGIGNSHNGKPLVLHVDHKDGNSHNDEIGNLRYLCPNCHSQTETWCGRNWANKRSKTMREELDLLSDPDLLEFLSRYDVHELSERFGLPYATLWRYFKKRGIKKPKKPETGARHRVVERPAKEELADAIQRESFKSLSRRYGVADNTIRKWCKQYGIDLSTSLYWRGLKDRQSNQ